MPDITQTRMQATADNSTIEHTHVGVGGTRCSCVGAEYQMSSHVCIFGRPPV